MTDTDKDTVVEEPVAAAPDASAPQIPNAVVVHRTRNEDGSIACHADIVGDVLPTEVPTVLRLGLKEFEERFGLR